MADKVRKARKRARRERKKSRLGLFTFILLLILISSYVAVLELSRPHVEGDALRIDQFVDAADDGNIRNALMLDVDGFVVGAYEREDGKVAIYNAPFLKNSLDELVELMIRNRIPTTIDQQNGKRVATLASYLIPSLILILLFTYLILSYRRGTGLFGIRSGARKINPEDVKKTFDDVAGQETAIADLREVVGFLKDASLLEKVGATLPKGILLYGPPGCGKTLIASALAGEADASFYSISGSDFLEMYVGVGASRVRDLFREARENAPAVIFIDEIDSIARQRTGGTAASHGTNSEQDQALNQILAEMDGFSPANGVIVVGATNRPDVLDAALLRPGRFDRTIGLERPDEQTRLEILQLHARGKQLDSAVDLAAIAKKSIGLSGADLAGLMNESAIKGARNTAHQVSQANLEQTLQKLLEDPDRQRRLSMRERSVARRATEEGERVIFENVAGQSEAIAELRDIQEFLTEPERFQAVGAAVPKGILLYGPPGCGKTLLARALAGETNAAFLAVSASEFIEVFVGEGASRMRDLFAEARSIPPAIIFIDEIDALGSRRMGRHRDSGEQDQTLNQLLAEMDGFSASKGLVVVAATNRPDSLDPALLRPGRFDRTVGLERPDENGRLGILKVHLKDKPLASGADLAKIARASVGLTGADLGALMNEAALLAARERRGQISHQDLEAAMQKILEAPEKQRRLSMRDRGFARTAAGENRRVTFADVAGVDDAIDELKEIKAYLAEPEQFVEIGARAPRGVLLAGPPGCGKTLLARAIAGEANAAFFAIGGTEFVEVFAGEGAGRARDLFAEARASAPSIIFIDEIDAVGSRRASMALAGQRESEQTLNQILIEMDGFDDRGGVIVIGATNRIDILDPALIRPGRFDRQIFIEAPDREGRAAILKLQARTAKFDKDIDFDELAAKTIGLCGADLANLVNEAALLARREGLKKIPMRLAEEAIDRSYLGVASRTRILSDEEKRVVAYHEAGHALVARALPDAGTYRKISLGSRGQTLGAAFLLDEGAERNITFRSSYVQRLSALLGGRVAEELVFGEPGSGAGGDLDRVANLAHYMVAELGMSNSLGLTGTAQSRANRSEEERGLIYKEVNTLVEEAHAQATKILMASRKALDRVAEALVKKETLQKEEIDKLAGAPPSLNGSGTPAKKAKTTSVQKAEAFKATVWPQ